MLTTVLGEPDTKGSADENPLGQPVLKPGLTDVQLQLTNAFLRAPLPQIFGSRMEIRCHDTNFKHTHEEHVSKLGKTTFPTEKIKSLKTAYETIGHPRRC